MMIAARRGLRRPHRRGARAPSRRSCRRRTRSPTLAGARRRWSFDGRRVHLPRRRAPGASDISFRVEPGADHAIIGSTGSGKTTLVNLVPRLFDATGGHACCVDGVDVRDLDPDAAVGPDRARAAEGRTCSPAPWRPTCATATPTRPTTSSGRRSRSPRRATSSRRCPTARRRRSPRAAPTCPAGSGNGSRSPGRWCAAREIYVFDDSFSALDLATDARLRAALRRRTPATTAVDRRPAGRRRSSTPTRSSCSTTARSWGVGTHDRTARQLRDLRRDRRIPAACRGGSMTPATRAPAERSPDRAREKIAKAAIRARVAPRGAMHRAWPAGATRRPSASSSSEASAAGCSPTGRCCCRCVAMTVVS